MAKIGLSEGTWTVIPEGTHVFKITGVNYKEDFGKMEVKMETKEGLKHTERFSLLSSNGDTNQGALNAFSYFAKVALNNFTLTEIDHEDLIGHFIECDVEHDVQPSNKDPHKNVTFVKLTDKRVSDGWDETLTPAAKSVQTEAPSQNSAEKAKLDLYALLG
jgi:hypothetical protein